MIPVNIPLLNGNESKYLQECISSGWISSEGPFVKKFEKEFSAKVGRKYGIAVCNGSVALDIAVSALEIKDGDEVIVPTFTIISCVAAIVRAGAKPVLVDCDPQTWNMDVNQIEDKITSKTKAIMPVHIYGLPVAMDPLIKLAKKYGLKIIEDSAEGLGINYKSNAMNKEKPCGSFGDVSTFSFYPNKLVTTGEGGMVVTDDEALAERCRYLRNLCFQADNRFVHEELGWNFRMSNLQAAVGLAQLENIDISAKIKRSLGEKYSKELSSIKDIQLPLSKTDYADNIYWIYGIVLNVKVPFNAKEIMKKLSERGIGTRPFFWPMHEQPVFNNKEMFINESYPVSEMISRRGFYIPSGLALTNKELNIVCKELIEILE